MAHTIVVGVDDSSPSLAALRWAARRAVATGQRIRILHVSGPEAVSQSAEAGGALRRAREILRTEFVCQGHRLDIETRLVFGRPLPALVEASLDASLVVVGTHKTGFVQGRVFGSRFLQLPALAHSDVAFVPDSSSLEREGIVVGVDDSSYGRAALAFAASEAERSRAELTLVRAWKGVAPAHEFAPASGAEGALARAERLLDAAAERLRGSHPGLTIRRRILQRATAEALVEASGRCALLVVGASGEGAQLGALGPVVHDTLFNLVAPTIVVRTGFDAATEIALAGAAPGERMTQAAGGRSAG
ncbi:universal stress protein [Compostimonas suwonensis]|nr:universal stress protein [Compostimonas suwonensis]